VATGTEQGEVDIPKPDAGFAFKAEMFVMNILLGYAKVFIGIGVLILLGALVVGQYQNWYRQNQRNTSAVAAGVERDVKAALLAALPEGDRAQAQRYGLGVIDLMRVVPEVDDGVRAELVKGAEGWMAAARDGQGTAASEAASRAAEIYRRLGMAAEQRAALELASDTGGAAAKLGAELNLAALDLDEGSVESAASRLRAVMDAKAGYLSERAALDLGAAYEHADRNGDAIAVYQQFATMFPGSARAEEAQARLTKLLGSGG
jgi:hypothetical protein